MTAAQARARAERVLHANGLLNFTVLKLMVRRHDRLDVDIELETGDGRKAVCLARLNHDRLIELEVLTTE